MLIEAIQVTSSTPSQESHYSFLFHFLYFYSFGSEKCRDGSFCLFHAIALELYHNFSFAPQLYSIFMLLNDAALSTREWHFRAVSTIKSNLRQIKLLGFFCCCFLFLLGRQKRSHHQGPSFVFQAY